MRQTKRYAAALGLGILAGFYVGARATTTVLKDRMESGGRPLVTTDQLAQIRRNLEEYQETLKQSPVDSPTDEWYSEHPIVQRVEREEAEAEARASGKSSKEAALELLRRSEAKIKARDAGIPFEDVARRSNPGGV